MNIREAAEQIKRTVPMDDILTLYGIQMRRDRFIQCPFHTGDHTASLKVYKGGKGWTCFGCHAGGSCIDFVMKMDSIGFADAVRKIDTEFHLDLLQPVGFFGFIQAKEDERQQRQRFGAQMAALREANDNEEALLDIMDHLWTAIHIKPVQERTAQDWDWWLMLKDELPDRLMQLAQRRRKEEMSFYEWQSQRGGIAGR